jgi:hypothetical protein
MKQTASINSASVDVATAMMRSLGHQHVMSGETHAQNYHINLDFWPQCQTDSCNSGYIGGCELAMSCTTP